MKIITWIKRETPLKPQSGLAVGLMSLLSILLLAVSPGVAVGADTEVKTTAGSTPAIRVADRIVTKEEFQRKLSRKVRRIRRRMKRSKRRKKLDFDRLRKMLKKQLKEREIKRLLLEHHAKKSGVRVNDSAVKERLKSIVKRTGSKSALKKKLKTTGRTMKDFRRDLRKSLMIEKFLKQNIPEITVSDQKLRRFYEKNKKSLGGKSFKTVKSRLRQRFKQKRLNRKRNEFLRKLRKRTDVQVNIPL